MEKYMAIDNVCAWPNIKKLPNGEIIAIIFGQPCHLLWEGTIECWVSSDDGRSWEFRSNPVVNEPETNRGNVAVGVLDDGEIMVLCGGWDKAQPAPEKYVQGDINDDRIKYKQKDKVVLNVLQATSKDNGETWTSRDMRIIDAEPAGWVPFGDILVLDDGDLGCAMYAAKRTAYSGARSSGCHYFKSSDGGESWRLAATIAEQGAEPATAQLPDGKLYAAVRGVNLDLYESNDQGKSWKYVSFLTGRGMYPGDFTLMDNGRLLLTYGIRNNGLYGVGATQMPLETEKWETPILVTQFGDQAWDGGYPSNVALDDGNILTAYYSGPNEHHNRYHMGTVIWNYDQLGKSRNRCR